jgi:hypothetical protein
MAGTRNGSPAIQGMQLWGLFQISSGWPRLLRGPEPASIVRPERPSIVPALHSVNAAARRRGQGRLRSCSRPKGLSLTRPSTAACLMCRRAEGIRTHSNFKRALYHILGPLIRRAIARAGVSRPTRHKLCAIIHAVYTSNSSLYNYTQHASINNKSKSVHKLLHINFVIFY